MEDQSLPPISHYEELPVAVFICNKNDLLTAFNPAAASLLDIPPQTGQKDWYPSCTIFDSNGQLINDAFQLVNDDVKANRREHRQEILIRLPDGSTRNIWVSSVAVCNQAQQYLGAIHILTDITFQRELESYKSLLFSIVEYCEDAIISKDLNGTITSWNPAAQKMFGYTEKEAIGKNISLIIPADHLADERGIIERIKKGEKVDHFQTVRITKEGKKLPLSLTISPIMDSKGQVIGASKIARDISQQKKAEEYLKRYAANLEELVEERTLSLKDNVGKLEIAKDELGKSLKKERELGELKSRFVSMASHEFRTPLCGIQLSASLMEKYAKPYEDEHINKHIGKVKKAVTDLTSTLNDFLSLEKLESGNVAVALNPLNLVDFAKEIIGEMQEMAKPGQRIMYHHQGAGNVVNLDGNLLRNCMVNLLSNAIKYSDEETTIDLYTGIGEKSCDITVKDSGIGIPEADQQHLFSPFFRAANTGQVQGTGLGLNIVARYAHLMNGRVSFESRLGEGTKFMLHFSRAVQNVNA